MNNIFRAYSEDMLGLGQIISFIANEGQFKFKNKCSIQNCINIWPGMIQQTLHSGLEMWIREKNSTSSILDWWPQLKLS